MLRVVLTLLMFLVFNTSWSLTFIVDSNGDADDLAAYTAADGTNTLRKCIRLANANAGADIINFNITGSTVITNTVGGGGAWFTVSSPVTIAGYTQTGASAGTPVVELNGAALGRWFCFSFEAGSDGSDISGLIIHGTNIGLRVVSSNGHTFSGNFIGVNAAGTAEGTNPITEQGIRLESSSNNTIGGTGGLIDRNIISECNQRGISIEGTSSNNVIYGNYIGVDKAGTSDIGNSQNGIWAQNCTDLIIGGSTVNHQNIVSGNDWQGMYFDNCDDAIIKGNIVGLGSDTSTAIGNSSQGITVVTGSDRVVIGGAASGERNYVSSNGSNGIQIENSDNCEVKGNYVGTEKTGLLARGNSGSGISTINCEVLDIGGDLAGEGNVICSNTGHGIISSGSDARNTTVQGNMIGVSADGSTALGNSAFGVALAENEDSQIGGTATLARNIVSNSGSNGMQIISSPRTVIENNFVGVDGTGLIDMGNGASGINLDNSADVVVGGTTTASRNIISGNNQSGLSLAGTSTGAIIKSNFIGVGVDGSTLLKNDDHGIWCGGTSDNMTVGGPTDAERNVISGNGQFTVGADPDNGITGDGIRILGTDNHLIQNNYIGTDSTGTIGLGNHWGGVSINDDSDNNDVIDNLISDNRNEGMWIYNGSDNNEIYRNIIGLGSDGSNLGNWDYGVFIHTNSSQNNIVGGSLANANTIAYTRGERPGLPGDGVIIGGGSDFNEITFNSIFCNAGEGIVLEGTGNESVATPVIVASNSNDINGTGTNGMTIHIYRNTTTGSGCNCEGEIYVGTTTVAGGVWSFTHNLGLNTNDANSVSVTQTTTNNSTSEFAACSDPMPVTYISYGATHDDNQILVSWSTINEINNSHFVIQLSTDGVIFEDVGLVEGNGNTSTVTEYSYQFESQGSDLIYVRLIQVDYDNTMSYGRMIALDLNNYKASVSYSNGQLNITNPDELMDVSIITLDGKEVWNTKIKGAGRFDYKLMNLASAVYVVRLSSNSGVKTEKISLVVGQ